MRHAAPPDKVIDKVIAAPVSKHAIEFLAHEAFQFGKAVKGAPFSAEAVTETVQTLADGNRITRRSTSSIARDSEGRTRRETQMAGFGGIAAEALPALITIDDPVAKAHYFLNTKEKTANKLPIPEIHIARGGGAREDVLMFRRAAPAHAAPGAMVAGETFNVRVREPLDASKADQQALGTRDIEGLKAEGTRSVLRIEAGEIGNERPMEVVSERWYSPELQMVVMTRHSDPRTGETTYRLTRVDRREPPPALFQVPPEYKVSEPRMEIRRKIEE
jgi:hypothetical protein